METGQIMLGVLNFWEIWIMMICTALPVQTPLSSSACKSLLTGRDVEVTQSGCDFCKPALENLNVTFLSVCDFFCVSV